MKLRELKSMIGSTVEAKTFGPNNKLDTRRGTLALTTDINNDIIVVISTIYSRQSFALHNIASIKAINQ